MSAASQKVPDRVPGDTECYHCLDSLKKERKAYEKKRKKAHDAKHTNVYQSITILLKPDNLRAISKCPNGMCYLGSNLHLS